MSGLPLDIDTITLATVRLTVAALSVGILLRWLNTRHAASHRWLWAAVLLQSLMLAPWIIRIPILTPATRLSPGGEMHSVTQVPPTSTASELSEIATVTARPAFTTADWLTIAWAIGLAVVMLLFAAAHLLVQFGIRRATRARDVWQRQLDRIARGQGITAPIELLVTETWGPLIARQPRGTCIVVPRDSWSGLSESQRDAVLLHELAHYKRNDHFKSLAMHLLAAFHWFNPLSWWVVTRFDEAAEWACDAHVKRRGEASAAALASALLTLAESKPSFRLGVSTARGSTVSERIRRLVSGPVRGESKMKKLIVSGLVASLMLVGFVHFRLVAREIQTETSATSQLGAHIEQFASELQQTTDPLQSRLAGALRTQSGQIVVMDQIAEMSRQERVAAQDDIVNAVLQQHFELDGQKATLKSPDDPIRSKLIAAGAPSEEDLQRVTAVCRSMAEQLQGDDEATLLVKRFLTEESGPTMLYIKELRTRMRPGMAMMSQTFGKVLARGGDGKFRVRPDARDKVLQIVSLRNDAQLLTTRLSRQIGAWAKDLVGKDPLEKKVQQYLPEPLFAARLISERLFGRQDLSGVSVNEVLDQLDQMVVDTSRGLEISDRAQPEVERVITEYEAIRERAGVLRETLKTFASSVADDDEASAGMKQLMSTDLGLAAVAQGANEVNVSVEQLMRALLAEMIEETDDGLRLRTGEERQEKVIENIQKAMREFRQARRRAAPIRELAEKLDDRELAKAIDTIGGMIVFRGLIEAELQSLQRRSMEAWAQQLFEPAGESLAIRSDAREQIEQMLATIERVEKELENNDF